MKTAPGAVLTAAHAAVFAALAGTAWLAHAADGPVKKVTVRSVAYFDFNKATLRAQDEPKLLAEVGKMKGVTWQTVTATGHTDSVGPTDYNERLSAQRAEAVKAFLVSKGLSPDMIHAEAKAEADPIAPNDKPSGRAKNRRAEIRFEGVQAAGE